MSEEYTKKLQFTDVKAYCEQSIRNNNAVADYCRTSTFALSGSTAGILGFTGITGFAFYFIAAIILWIMLLVKAGYNWKKYFINRTQLITNGFFGGLFTYILFWTFLYGMVHVY